MIACVLATLCWISLRNGWWVVIKRWSCLVIVSHWHRVAVSLVGSKSWFIAFETSANMLLIPDVNPLVFSANDDMIICISLFLSLFNCFNNTSKSVAAFLFFAGQTLEWKLGVIAVLEVGPFECHAVLSDWVFSALFWFLPFPFLRFVTLVCF